MITRNIIMLCLVSAVVGAAASLYYFPQIETKNVEVTKEVVKTDIKTIIKTVKAPDGTTETTTTIEDHSVKTGTDKRTSVEYRPKDWHVSGSVYSGLPLTNPYYGVHIERRIFGPFYVGGLLSTKGDVGLSVGFEF